MKLIASLLAVTALSLILLSCSTSHITSPAAPNISGQWEFLVVSATNNTSITGMEVALKEGQVPNGGVSQPDGQVSASGATQISFITLDATTMNISSFGGTCSPNAIGNVNDLNGSVSGLGGSFDFSFHEAGNLFNVTGTVAVDGQSMTGTYAAQSGSNCNDSGTITGTLVPKLSGTYTGQLLLPDATTDTATATLSQNSSGVLSVNLAVTGADNTSFTLTGPVTGRAFSVQGTFQGQTVSYNGYSELIFDSSTQTNRPSIYFANVTNPAQPVYAGTLMVPIT